MFSKLKKKLALSWIGNNSNDNQVNQNCIVNNTVNQDIVCGSRSEIIEILKKNKNYRSIQKLSQQDFSAYMQAHPLFPSFSAKYDPNLERLVSTPETKDALNKYPRTVKTTVKLDYVKYPYMDKSETPWEYAYRTQTPVELETLAYKEYLGDMEDPFPVGEFQEGLMTRIDAPDFPPALPATLSSGDTSIPIMLRRVACMEYGFLCLENEEPNASLSIRIRIQHGTNKTDITITRKYDCDLRSQLAREKLICNLMQNRLIIKIASNEILNTAIDKDAFETDFFKSANVFVNVIEELLFIEQNLSCKFIPKLSTVNDDDFFMILLLSASLKNKWFLQQLTFDDSIRCSYQALSEDVFKERTDQEELIGNIPDFCFNILGVNFFADKYTLRLRKARINNEKSVKKNIKRKRKNIMLTFKPSSGNDFLEKYSLLENIKIVEE